VPAKRTTVVRAGEPDAQHAASRTMPRGTHRADDLDAGACQWFVSLSLALRQVCRILYFFCHQRHVPPGHIRCTRLAPAKPK
jgi:hypothetical protein